MDYDGLLEIADGEVLQTDHYYPFGMRMGGLSLSTGTENRYRYNGKEFHQEFNLGLYDYGARMYDPVLGRFTGVDPIAEAFNWVTSYNYAENEPVAHIDLWGLQKAKPKPPHIISREEWDAGSPITGPGRSFQKIKGSLSIYYNTIVIHHSGNADSNPTMRDVQNEHMDGAAQKADIGYHFGIDSKGNIFEGRPINVQGAHVNKANTGKIGIVLLGDLDTQDSGLNLLQQLFEWFDDEVTPEMQTSLNKLVSFLAEEYGIEYVGGHNEVNCERNCPGDLGGQAAEEAKKHVNCSGPNCQTGETSSQGLR